AQAATWHLTDGLSWSELEQKVHMRHLDGSVEMYFNPQQLNLAIQIVQEAVRRAEAVDMSHEASPGESESSYPSPSVR
ncbi:MAG TPA: hypothetical protein VIY86_07255, partial [Pirellulaceae bacterium]